MLALYSQSSEEALAIPAAVVREDSDGLGLRFEPPDPVSAAKLEDLVAEIPAIEQLESEACRGMGTTLARVEPL